MPRYPRNRTNTSFIHVMSQGINKSYIFESDEDKRYYMFLMKKLKKEEKVKVFAYCIMDNHSHLLLEVKRIQDLSKFMQRLNTAYGFYYNKKYNRVGYVFRNRFKSEGIYDEMHLYNCIKYIYDNPVKAGICAKPELYPFSNFKRCDIVFEECFSFIDTEEDKILICQNTIDEFLRKTKINMEILKNDEHKIKELLYILRTKYNISFDKIAEQLEISKKVLWKLMQKK